MTNTQTAKELLNFMYTPENWLISQFCGEVGISIKNLDKMAAEDEDFADTLDLAYTIQEYKIAKGALTGKLKETTSLRLLEKYHDWKSSAGVVVANSFKGYADGALKRANDLTSDLIEADTDD